VLRGDKYDDLPVLEWFDVCQRPCVVIRTALYLSLLASHILCFDLEMRGFSVILHSSATTWMETHIISWVTQSSTSSLRTMLFHLHFWETEEACDWLLCRTMRLDTLQPFTRKWRIFVYKVGAYENGNVIFLAMGSNNFIFYLDSMYLEELSTVGPMS
jgi:hypothetical protein